MYLLGLPLPGGIDEAEPVDHVRVGWSGDKQGRDGRVDAKRELAL